MDHLTILIVTIDGMDIPVPREIADKYRFKGDRQWYVNPPEECIPDKHMCLMHFVPQMLPFSGHIIREVYLTELCG